MRVAIIKKKKKKEQNRIQRCSHACGGTGTSMHCWWEYKIVQPPVGNRMAAPQKLKTGSLYDQAILILGIYQEEFKAGN